MGYESKNYEAIFSGGYSSLNPNYGNFIGFRVNAGQISSPTSIQTANQVNEVVSRIREGIKNVEVGTVDPGIFEQIPKEHFKEMAALMKLSGVKASVHAPIIDAAGFGQRGYEDETGRMESERRLFNVLGKSHELDPDGNVPVVIHSTGAIPGHGYAVDESKKPGEEGRFRTRQLVLINQETKQMTGIEEQGRYEIEAGRKALEKGETMVSPTKEMDKLNDQEWKDKLQHMTFYVDRAYAQAEEAKTILHDELEKPFKEVQKLISEDKNKSDAYRGMEDADTYLQSIDMQLKREFDKAFKYGDEEQRQKLMNLSEEYKKRIGELNEKDRKGILFNIGDKAEVYRETIQELKNVTESAAPKVYVPVEEFAMDKAATTFGNLASKSWEKWKDKAPLLAIENMYQGMAFSKADDLKKMVEMSREKFVENMVDKKKMSEGDAKKVAEKMIGVTWDVGHLNMMRKSGFTEEDIVKETEKISKLVKHVHITDNFGYSDSHLPPGMGNVPIKQILEKLEKAGALKDSRMVMEAGGFVQHFKQSPHPFVLSALGSPIYGMKAAPYWNQAASARGNYFSSPLAYLPEQHFSMYGSGFSSLPLEVGGQIAGTRSRFSGTDNA